MGKVRPLIITFRWTQLNWAVTLEVTNFQSASRHKYRNNQSIHDAWLGSKSTGPAAFKTSALYARNRNSSRTSHDRNVFIPRIPSVQQKCARDASHRATRASREQRRRER